MKLCNNVCDIKDYVYILKYVMIYVWVFTDSVKIIWVHLS